MKVSFIQVTIEPWTLFNSENKELRILVRADGKEFNLKEVLHPDSFESEFDRVMEFAKLTIKEAAKGQGRNET